MSYEKCKLNQDQIAMLIADWEHGELTKCECECKDCPLNIVSSTYGVSLCKVLEKLSISLCRSTK